MSGRRVLLNVICRRRPRRIAAIQPQEKSCGNGRPEINVINMLISSLFLVRIHNTAIRENRLNNHMFSTPSVSSPSKSYRNTFSFASPAQQQQLLRLLFALFMRCFLHRFLVIQFDFARRTISDIIIISSIYFVETNGSNGYTQKTEGIAVENIFIVAILTLYAKTIRPVLKI